MPRIRRWAPRAAAATAATVVAATVLASASRPVGAVENYPTPSSGSWTVQVRGNGHGHGLSQYGARGAAAAGLNYPQILAFYYPNTALGMNPTQSRTISVRVDNNGEPTTVANQAGLTLNGVALTAAGAAQWQLRTYTGGYLVYRADSSGAWTLHSTRVFASPATFGAPANTQTVLYPDGSTAAYRGQIAAVSVPGTVSSTGTITVNTLALDDYLKGVVPSEMPASWPAAAVQAQAVAARSYAAYYVQHPRTAYYDICASTNCQVYGGMDAEQSQSNAAIAATPNVVVAYQNQIAFAEFSASNGGITSDDGGAHPYFVTKADPYDTAASGDPYTTPSTYTVSAAQLASYLGWSSVTGIQITSRAPSGYTGQWGGLVDSAVVTGVSNGSATSQQMSGAWLASAMGLPYRYFTIQPTVPLGHLDSVQATSLHTYRIRGWSFDPTNTAASNSVVITAGSASTTVTASQPRPDVQAAYQTASAAHGFDVTLTLPGGTTQVCATGLMLSTSDRSLLGCQTVTVPTDPMGNFESATAVGGGQFRLSGWEFDPDNNGGPGLVQIYVDYRTWYFVNASSPRPDVQAAFGLANAATGFSTTIPVPSGQHVICVYGINASGTPGTSRQLLCRWVSA